MTADSHKELKDVHHSDSSKKLHKKKTEPEFEVIPFVEYSDKYTMLFDIFEEHWGSELKGDADTFDLWYDFDPYNAKEPLLMALMAREFK